MPIKDKVIMNAREEETADQFLQNCWQEKLHKRKPVKYLG